MKRSVLYITIALILLCSICLSVLPRQTICHGTFSGLQLVSDGTAHEKCDIGFTLTKLDYLFREYAKSYNEFSMQKICLLRE